MLQLCGGQQTTDNFDFAQILLSADPLLHIFFEFDDGYPPAFFCMVC